MIYDRCNREDYGKQAEQEAEGKQNKARRNKDTKKEKMAG